MKRGVLTLLGVALMAVALAFATEQALAQGTGVPRPGTVESTPLPPPGSQPSPPGGVILSQEPAPASPGQSAQPAQPSAPTAPTARPTLVPEAGDPLEVKEVTLPSRPAAILSGASSWDEGFESLKNGVKKLEDELAKAGIRPAGRPIAVFLETDDMGFRYDMMIPIEERAAEGRVNVSPEIRFGRTPDGKAYHFVHKGPYEEIDSTYETITAYLDSKGIIAKEAFIEEYVTDLTTPADENLEINIFVQPR